MSYFRGGQAGLASHVGDRILHSRPLKKFSRWLGMGAYKESVPNQLVNPGTHGFQHHSAQFHSVPGEEGAVFITNKEFISDMNVPSGAINFSSLLSSPINPGLGALFPWLSQVAQFYDEYQFEQLVFEFRSMVTEGNSTAAGSVIMACQYNALNSPFTNKQQMENYDYAVSGKVTDSLTMGVECDPSKRNFEQLFVRTGGVPTNADAKTYDVGLLQVAIAGVPSTSVALGLGEVWVHYRIKLSKTKLLGGALVSMNGGATNSAVFLNIPTSVSATYSACIWDINAGATGTFTTTSALLAAGNVVAAQSYVNTADLTVINTVGATQSVNLVFPANCNPYGSMYVQVMFMINFSQPASAVTVNTPTYSTSLVNCTYVNEFHSTSVANVSDSSNILIAVYKTTSNGSFTINVTGLGLSAGSQSGTRNSCLRVVQLPYNHTIGGYFP